MQINEKIKGFILKEKAHLAEVGSDSYLFEHEKSGAKLFYLQNNDDNKVFSISFRTPPSDDTGLPHILEHSVLCGSRKFPLKEPFVELVKGSLNTFLNAMTFADKTMYPVASRNDKDFRNLMDVYLDAVFFPNIYQNKQTLEQEGWHYEILDKANPLEYKGVVYNEMKGVYSSPDSWLEKHTMSALFPNTTYGFESGGFPAAIPELTQEQFEDFHKCYYHPANSYIFLYGNLDIEDTLAFINEEYLNGFAKIKIDSQIKKQAMPPKTQKIEAYYPLGQKESTQDKTFLDWSVVVGDVLDVEQCFAFQLLEHYLLETSAAPLKKALVEAGVAKEVSGYYNNRMLQPTFSVRASGANAENESKFISVIYKTLQEITRDGIDRELFTASLNRMEFHLREADFGAYPKGLVYAINCMNSWLYDGDPKAYLCYDKVLASLREKISSRYYESLIENYLLDNTHRSVVVLSPQPGMQEEEEKKVSTKLAALKSKLSGQELEELIAKTKTLLDLQSRVDTPETLAKIPLLQRSDIKSEAPEFVYQIEEAGSAKYLYLEKFTNQIAYVNLHFETQNLPQDLIFYGYLLKDLLGRLSSKTYSYEELAKQINLHTGGIYFNFRSYADKENADLYSTKFVVSGKTLVRNLDKLMALLQSILTETLFSDQKRLQELIAEGKAVWDAEFFARGQTVAVTRLLSYFSQAGGFADQGYLEYYRFLASLAEENLAKIEAKLEQTAKTVFNKENLLVSYCTGQQEKEEVLESLQKLVHNLSTGAEEKQNYYFSTANKNEGLATSAQVQYVAAGGNFKKQGYEYTGALRVLENIMRYDYLWNNIRVKGGAYGANARFDYNGNSFFTTYRDPNLRESLEVFAHIPAYLENFQPDAREMTKYVIGTISNLDRPLTPAMELELVIEYYLRGIDLDLRQLERDQVIACTKEDIQKLASLVKAILADDYYCVLGSESKIKENQKLFSQITPALLPK